MVDIVFITPEAARKLWPIKDWSQLQDDDKIAICRDGTITVLGASRDLEGDFDFDGVTWGEVLVASGMLQ